MGKIWKYVLILMLVLVVAGVLLGGTGLITGASLDRVLGGLNGIDGLWQSGEALARHLLELLPF